MPIAQSSSHHHKREHNIFFNSMQLLIHTLGENSIVNECIYTNYVALSSLKSNKYDMFSRMKSIAFWLHWMQSHAVQLIISGVFFRKYCRSEQVTANIWSNADPVLWCHTAIVGHNGPLARYVKLRIAHALGMPGTFSPPPTSKEAVS